MPSDYLLKTEPSEYSFADLQRDGVTQWDGVSNPVAVKNLREMKPGARLVIADMLPHDREEYRQQMGHVWLGFSEDQIRRLLAGAGFGRIRIVALPVNPAAKGPALFVATARKDGSAVSD